MLRLYSLYIRVPHGVMLPTPHGNVYFIVALVIGRQGEMINRLQGDSGARIQVAPGGHQLEYVGGFPLLQVYEF